VVSNLVFLIVLFLLNFSLDLLLLFYFAETKVFLFVVVVYCNIK
jgi:hypothetical protein